MPLAPVNLTVANALVFVKTSTAPFNIVDTQANIQANIAKLATMGTQLVSIVQQDSTNSYGFPISVANVLALAPKMVDSKNQHEVFTNITDNAGNISSNLAQLLVLNQTAQITNFNVVDTAANINANQASLFSLRALLNSYILPDGTTITITANTGTLLTVSATDAVNFFKEGLTAPIRVLDSGSAIASNADGLAKIGKQLIVVQENTGSEFTWQINVNDVLALAAKTQDSFGNPEIFSNVIDSAQNVAANVTSLLKLSSQIPNVIVNDNVTNILANAAVLTKLGAELAITVTDTVANINANQSNLLALKGALNKFILPDGTVLSVSSTDGTSATINAADAIKFVNEKLTAPIHIADYNYNIANNAHALALIGNQITLIQDISGYNNFKWPIKAADVVILAPKMVDLQGHSITFSDIADTAKNIADNSSALLKLSTQVASIFVTDTANNVVTNANALATLNSKLIITINDKATNVAANEAALLKLGSSLVAIKINDTAANIATSIAALLPLSAALTVTVTDTVKAINASQSALLSLKGALKSLVLPDGTSISIISTDGKSVTLAANDAVNFAKEGLTTPINVTDESYFIANNAHALAKMGTQLVSIQDTETNPISYAISVADVLALAPKIVNANGKPEIFNNVSSSVDTAANVAANATGLLKISSQIGTIYVVDTASSVATNSAGLVKLGNKVSVTVSDSAQNLLANITGLNKLGAVLAVTVVDTFQNINSNFTKLHALGTQLKALSLPDGNLITILSTDGSSVTLDTINAVNFGQEGLNAPIHIIDNGAGIVAEVSALVKLGKQVVSVQDSNETVFGYSLTVAQALYLAPKIINSVGKAEIFSNITDTAATIKTNLTALLNLGNQVVSVTATGTVKDMVTNVTSLIQLQQHLPLSVTIADSAANINANQAKLLTLGNALKTLIMPDQFIQIQILSADATSMTMTAINAINFAYEGLTIPVHVKDTSANLALGADALAKIGSQLLSIQNTDGSAITGNFISVADVLALANKTFDVNGKLVVFTYVTDSAANILTNQTALINLGKQISNVAFTDTVANVITDIGKLQSLSGKLAITVSDSSQNIVNKLGALQALNTSITNITITDAVIPTLIINAGQYAQDSLILAKITTPYNLTITGETAANVVNDLNNSHVTTITITDTAAHLVANIDALQNISAKLGGINLSDAGAPILALTASQYAHDSSTLAKISTPYNLTISGETAANVSVDLSNKHVINIAVADSVAQISANLTSLESQLSKISAITLTDASSPNLPVLSLSGSQFAADIGVVNAIQTPYLLSIKDSITNITAAALGTINNSNVHIELMPTVFDATLIKFAPITDINLSLINLTGDIINEKVYQTTGTELDIINNGKVVEQLIFVNDTEAQLQILGVDPSIIHLI